VEAQAMPVGGSDPELTSLSTVIIEAWDLVVDNPKNVYHSV
jgi:hypothetical protein